MKKSKKYLVIIGVILCMVFGFYFNSKLYLDFKLNNISKYMLEHNPHYPYQLAMNYQNDKLNVLVIRRSDSEFMSVMKAIKANVKPTTEFLFQVSVFNNEDLIIEEKTITWSNIETLNDGLFIVVPFDMSVQQALKVKRAELVSKGEFSDIMSYVNYLQRQSN